ncbi:SDR family oxidoreductase [Bacillus sp. DJP31]|uniref:SDR family oxidoreductase n=1 Tax=Bacillus sp. DJP31 TaxID=3409789 RepID=UPI003BB8161D
MKKIAIVTGANSGMGLATSIELAKKGLHVVMVCRNEARGMLALEMAKEQSQSDSFDLMLCDLGSLASIGEFAAAFLNNYEVLDVLVNNAGVVSLKREQTVDGFEVQMGINHLGHFLLTNLLLEPLKKSEQGRIVNVSSGAHKWGKIDFEDPYFAKGYNVLKGYGQSKLANILFTNELANRLSKTNVTVNSLHPGAVATSLGVNRTTGFGKTVYKILSPFFKSPAQGASTAIYLATSPEVARVTGNYFINEKIAPTSTLAKDKTLARKFWEWSEKEVEAN